jgi:transposase
MNISLRLLAFPPSWYSARFLNPSSSSIKHVALLERDYLTECIPMRAIPLPMRRRAGCGNSSGSAARCSPGPIDADAALSSPVCACRVLAPTLQKGDWLILDNLATHKVRGIVQAIDAVGAQILYLPPYSPDFNPIENMWSKIKQIFRSQAPRTESELLLAAKAAFQAISAADCEGFFFSAQYAT